MFSCCTYCTRAYWFLNNWFLEASYVLCVIINGHHSPEQCTSNRHSTKKSLYNQNADNRFEKASILFNLAAIYSQLATNQSLGSEDGIKKAASYYQQSAGVFQHVSEALESWGIQGSANTQLSALSNLMLAQAQEVFLYKAVNGMAGI